MDLEENSRLIKYYLALLKNKKEEYLRNNPPPIPETVDWDRINSLIKKELEEDFQKNLEWKILFNNLLRQHKARKKELRLLRSKFPWLFHIKIKYLTNILLISGPTRDPYPFKL